MLCGTPSSPFSVPRTVEPSESRYVNVTSMRSRYTGFSSRGPSMSMPSPGP